MLVIELFITESVAGSKSKNKITERNSGMINMELYVKSDHIADCHFCDRICG